MKCWMKSKKCKTIILFFIIVIAAFLLYRLGFAEKIKNIKLLQQWLKSFGTAGYIIYILIYCLSAVLMMPGSVLTIAAGILYGPYIGSIVSLLGATCGAVSSFLIARYFMRDIIKSKYSSNSIYQKIDGGFKDYGYSFLILTRLVPVFPYNLQNYAYGLTGIKTSTYIFWTFICMIPGAFIYAYMAGEIAEKGISKDLILKLTLSGIFLFLISLIPKYLAQKKGINLK